MIVLANGCFDVLHAGHVQHLKEAKAMGDYLVVALTTDESVKKEKGEGRPVNTWDNRYFVLMALRCVDCVLPSESGVHAILNVKPHIFVKGGDRTKLSQRTLDACKSVGAEIRFTNVRTSMSGKKLSSSDLIGVK